MQTQKTNSFVFCLLSFVLILFSFFLFLFSCKRSTAPNYNPQNLQLQVLDVSCTEAWLSLKTKNDYLNKTLKLFQDDSLKLEKKLTTEDSILFVENLWPNTSYQFQVTIYDGNKLIAKSSTLTATTMDTTSHNFTWQTFEFGGQGGSSSFYDVAIIDENDIWAVGEIYTAEDKYNAAHWDGEKWELIKIANDSYPRRVVYAFGKNDVWFDGTIKWDGTRYSVHMKNFPLMPNGDGWYKNAMWGTSSKNFYLVGYHGMIAHYDGQQWQRIESGTDLRLLDIFGAMNPVTNQKTILTVGANLFHGPETVVLQIKGNNTIKLNSVSFDKSLTSVWSSNGLNWFLTGYDTFFNTTIFNKGFRKISNLPDNLKYRIRGSAFNNIFIVGENGFIWNYNGLRWKNLSDNMGLYYSVDVKNDLIVITGTRPINFVIGPARIKIGKRN